MTKYHTILAFAHNEPGVLNKLFSLIRRKRYNVESITAGHTHVEGISRMTIAFSREEGSKIEQIVRQIDKITEVTKTEDVTSADVVNREMVLLKVKASAKERASVAATVDVMRGRIVHIAPEHLIIELTGSVEKIDGAIDIFKENGLLGIARTGAVVMHRDEEDLGFSKLKGRIK